MAPSLLFATISRSSSWPRFQNAKTFVQSLQMDNYSRLDLSVQVTCAVPHFMSDKINPIHNWFLATVVLLFVLAFGSVVAKKGRDWKTNGPGTCNDGPENQFCAWDELPKNYEDFRMSEKSKLEAAARAAGADVVEYEYQYYLVCPKQRLNLAVEYPTETRKIARGWVTFDADSLAGQDGKQAKHNIFDRNLPPPDFRCP